MRLFVAVPLAAAARDAAAGAIAAVRRRRVFRAAPVRWVEPRNLHVTLHFLGETRADVAAAVAAALAPARVRPPFRAALGPAGLFPAHGPPRVVWLSVRDGSAQLAALRQAVGRRLALPGYRPDRRPYRPHLTIGRVRASSSVARRALDAELAAIVPPPVAWTVDRIVLMESRPSPAGASYRVVGEARLGGVAAQAAEAGGATC